MKKWMIVVVLLLSFAVTAAVYAANGYPWKDHAAPYDFMFGNHIDTHQQSQVNGKDGEAQLEGFFYIKFTGEDVDGVPKAVHGNCNNEEVDCTVGWKLKGVAVQATLLHKPEGGHPVWCVDPEDVPRAPGYSHFHWEGAPEHAGELPDGNTYDGYLLKLTAQDRFYFNHHGGFLVNPGIDTDTHANVVTDC